MPNQQSYFSTVLNPSAPHTSQPRPRIPSSTLPAQPASFTPTQRSLQARAKPYDSAAAGEAYEIRQLREQAANILSKTELLCWYSGQRNETISQTRTHFQNILLGLPDADVLWREEWEVPVEQRVRKDKDRDGEDMVMGGISPARSAKGKEKEKGKRKA